MELRDEIADVIELSCDDRAHALRYADRILTIPKMAEALARAGECPRLRVDDDDI